MEEFALALNDCNEALELDPRSSGAYSCRVKVYAAMGDLESAAIDSLAGILRSLPQSQYLSLPVFSFNPLFFLTHSVPLGRVERFNPRRVG